LTSRGDGDLGGGVDAGPIGERARGYANRQGTALFVLF